MPLTKNSITMEFQLLGHSTTRELQSVHDLCFKVYYIYIYIWLQKTQAIMTIVVEDSKTMVFVVTI